MKRLNKPKSYQIRPPREWIQALIEPNIDLDVALKLSLLSDTVDTCPSTGGSLFPPTPLPTPDFSQQLREREGTDESRLTVRLVGGALSLRGIGGQEQGLVVHIAVWGGRFVVRPEFCRAHLAAQGEQRLAQLPCNHRILEGAARPGGKRGREEKKKRKYPWLDVLRRLNPHRLLLSVSTHSLPTSFSFLSLTHHSRSLSPAPSLSSSLFYLGLVLPRWYCRLLPGEELLRMAWRYHYTLQP